MGSRRSLLTQLIPTLMLLNYIITTAFILAIVKLTSGKPCTNIQAFGEGVFKQCTDRDYCSECPMGYTHCIRPDSNEDNSTCSICMTKQYLHLKHSYKIKECFELPKKTTKTIVLED